MVRLWDSRRRGFWYRCETELTSAGDVLLCCNCLSVDSDTQQLGVIILHVAEDALDGCVGWHSCRP